MAAFPSSSGTYQESVDSAWRRIREMASYVKSRSVTLNNSAAAGSISSSLILDYATFLADAKLALQSAASVQGIAAYAQQQIADPTFDIVASYNDMVTAINSVTAWIVANFPKDANGFLLAKNFTAANDGRTEDRQFTSAQTAGLRTALASLIATIN